jgi:hypothetical protein
MITKALIRKYSSTIGSTTIMDGEYLVEEIETELQSKEGDTLESSSETSSVSDNSEYWSRLEDEESLNEIFACSTVENRTHGVDAEHLSKVWLIDMDTAKRTLEVTTSHRQHVPNPKLAKNYTTNYRMLRYKRIQDKFFMDTFFATKKAGKSTRGHTCCQLFVTDKGFLYVVPMKSKSEVLNALKQFSNEIGAPEAIIADSSKEQKSQDVKLFLNEIGTYLRVLEEGTP